MPVLIVLPFLGLLGWWIVGRGLAPLAVVAQTLSQRDPTSLRPITVDKLPIEVQPLVESLNALLQRLDESFDTQRRFAADAAHELRTPLTALTLQIQLAARAQSVDERAIAFERMEQGVKRATRLVQQLLTMARLDPEAAQKPAVPTDLALWPLPWLMSCDRWLRRNRSCSMSMPALPRGYSARKMRCGSC